MQGQLSMNGIKNVKCEIPLWNTFCEALFIIMSLANLHK